MRAQEVLLAPDSSIRPSSSCRHERHDSAGRAGTQRRLGHDGWGRGDERAVGSCGQTALLRHDLSLPSGVPWHGCTSMRMHERLRRVGSACDLHALLVSRVVRTLPSQAHDCGYRIGLLCSVYSKSHVLASDLALVQVSFPGDTDFRKPFLQ